MNNTQNSTILSFFPLTEPREKQTRALQFIERAVTEHHVKDIVIAAPTGIGKTGIGVAAAYWAGASTLEGEAGAYYLVTQKMLQDQLERDMTRYRPGLNDGIILKSSSEYECVKFKQCSTGIASKKCGMGENCTYRRQKNLFMSSRLGVTNYSYFLTERLHVKRFAKRKLLICDEVHGLASTIERFMDLVVAERDLEKWAPDILEIPILETIADYVDWVSNTYLGSARDKLGIVLGLAENGDDVMAKDAFALDQHIHKIERALELIQANPTDWVYWQGRDRDNKIESIARPLSAAPFMSTLTDMGDTRLYMSAYPGSKAIFCRTLGLDPDKVAWCSLKSTFPVANRPIVMLTAGSMSKRNIETTLPNFMRMVRKVLLLHKAEKGLIHCGSYALGDTIYRQFNSEFPGRLIFPRNAEERDDALARHSQFAEPTVVISPSMTEGFDFAGDIARWQIIAKAPYLSLSDKQVVAKKDRDPDWYALQTAMTVVQAAGRIVRSDTDHGVTYILDSDVERLINQHPDFFPAWFTEAFVWRKS